MFNTQPKVKVRYKIVDIRLIYIKLSYYISLNSEYFIQYTGRRYFLYTVFI